MLLLRKILVFLMLSMIILQGTLLAAPYQKATELTQIRCAAHTDVSTGNKSVRLVVDVTDKVEVDSTVIMTPTPRILVNIKGADSGSLDKAIEIDKKIQDQGIIDKVTINRIDRQNTQMVIELPNMIKNDDFRVFTLRSNPEAKKPFRVVVDINKSAPVVFNFTAGLKNKVIALDAGHGGNDPGAIGLSKLQEKTVTLAVTKQVKVLLERAGAKVLMTRMSDKEVDTPNATDVQELGARTAVANNRDVDIFLSVHANAFTNRQVGGTATYYYQKSPYDEMLAKNIQKSIIQTGGLKDRGIQQAGFYVVKRTKVPAALVEMAFISNPQEEKLMDTPAFQQQMAQGIVQGIERFFKQAVDILGGAS